MLTVKEKEKRKQIKMLCIEDLVPQDHLLRKVENALDFSFIYDEVKDLYCADNGRPSIDPVVLFKLCIVNYIYGLNSMRRTIRECEVNMAYRWFLGYDLMEAIPHFSTFGKNYSRRFEGTEIFEKLFERILNEAIACKLVDTNVVYIDGTHIKANANTKKNIKVQVQKEAKHYQKQLLKEINADREAHGKKPFENDDGSNPPETKEITVSKSDPESGLFHKGEHKKCFAYTAHTACDKNNFVLHTEITPGNVHDSKAFDKVYKKLKKKFGKPEAAVLDAGYKTPWICRKLCKDLVTPVMPYRAPMGAKKDNPDYRTRNFVYDEYYDCYLCPQNQVLEYSTTNREGYREYKSNPAICAGCPNLKDCTKSQNMTRVITRHIWQEYVEHAEDVRLTPYGKALYETRGQTIERVFADAKEKHGLRFARVNGLAKVKAQVLLTFACMNLKKLAKYKARTSPLSSLKTAFLRLLSLFTLKRNFAYV
jgi:transposase